MSSKPYALQLQLPVWLATLVAASVAFSLGLACAVPLAAFAALGALTLERRATFFLTLTVVLANQVLGFTVLHYPRDIETFAWGGIFLFVGFASTAAAFWMKERLGTVKPAVASVAIFLVAFAAYEGGFFFASLASGSGLYAYAPSIVLRIFEVNVVAFAGLLLLDRLASFVAPSRTKSANFGAVQLSSRLKTER
ncbi:MAG: hypothetical protein AB1508_01850 [Pseudomonadota bacterium]